MSPDARTLFAIIALLSCGGGFLLLAMWSSMRERSGLRTWASSLFVRVPAFVLLLGRGDVPVWMTIDLSNALVLAGSGLGYVATRELAGVRIDAWKRGLIILAPALVWLAACQSPVIYDDVVLRTVAVAFPLSVYAAATALAFLRILQTSRWIRMSFSFLWAIAALGHGIRCVLVVVNPPDQMLNNPDIFFTLSLLVPIASFAIGIFLIGFLYREWRLTELRRRAERDWMTGVLNRTGFRQAVENLMARSDSKMQLAMLVLDLDHFKSINDRFGHAAGDGVLVSFCRSIEAALPSGAVFGRLGGEEFAVALTFNGYDQDALAIADGLRRHVAASAILPEIPAGMLTVSIGVGVVPVREYALDMLLVVADAGLYEAKRQGRNQVCLGRRSMAELKPAGESGLRIGLVPVTSSSSR